jgi:hypothetical protein
MSVRVDVLPGEDSNRPDVVLSWTALTGSAHLEHETHLGGDLYGALDLARPSEWRRLRVRDWSRTAVPLLQAVAGRKATKSLGVAVERWSVSGPIGNPALLVDTSQATPWLRLAVIHSLDRWLHLPLDQALLHAELAVATLRAALSLPQDAEARDRLIGEALGWARRASDGVTRFLHDLPGRTWPLPPALHRSLQSLIDGYASLRAMVLEPDAALSAVSDAWKEILNGSRVTNKGSERSRGHPDSRDPSDTHPPSPAVRSLIDPRHVRARVFELGNKPQSAEIVLASAEMRGQDAVQVQVPSFQHHIDPEIAQRLMARLTNRASGADHCFAPLVPRAASTSPNRPTFECTMPLRGSRLEDVRADVFDAVLGVPPAGNDAEHDLLRTRQGVLLLRDWRRHVAQAQLGSLDGELPDLVTLARLNPAEWLDDQLGSAEDVLPPMVRGPGEPLVAELAAALQIQTA